MADFETYSDQSKSRTDSSSSCNSGCSDMVEEEGLSSFNKLNRIMDWFKQKGIQAGDPLTIQQDYLRVGKNKIAALLTQQNKNVPIAAKKGLRKVLSIQTKFC